MNNVLISAYAVSPSWGSEPGMGWNWIINIAKYNKVFVITEGQWREEIMNELENLPQKDNIQFFFNPVSDSIRRMCWNQGDWRFYWYYRKWQKKALVIAKEIINNTRIDVIHQLNMIGFREPGFLWKIDGIPIVWGPIGGLNSIPKEYRQGTSIKDQLKMSLKEVISMLQLEYHPRVRKMMKKSFIIGAVKSAQEKVEKIYKKKIVLINETGTDLVIESDDVQYKNIKSDFFDILWVGRLIPTKRLDIAINTLALLKDRKVRLTICGTGTEQQVEYYRKMISFLGIEDKIRWLGKVDHSQIIPLMKQSDLFFMTSVADATSTVIVEAITAHLPILSFNACGFGKIVNDFAGETIELSYPKQSEQEFAKKIRKMIDHPESLEYIRKNERDNKKFLSWDYKGQMVTEIYRNVMKKS